MTRLFYRLLEECLIYDNLICVHGEFSYSKEIKRLKKLIIEVRIATITHYGTWCINKQQTLLRRFSDFIPILIKHPSIYIILIIHNKIIKPIKIKVSKQ